MSEIEVKVLNIDVDQIRDKLIGMGAKLVKKENQSNHMYDYPGDTLFENFKGFCRLREVENLLDGTTKFILGVKKMVSQEKYKIMKEEETEVQDGEATKRFLEELGLYNRANDKKYRESYQLNGALYEIDIWDKEVYPHPYLEIESENEADMERAIDVLGVNRENVTSKNLYELRKDLGFERRY